MMQGIVIAQTAIRQVNGLFCLNDLHRASGKERRHEPSNWLANQQTAELIEELQATGIPVAQQKQQVIHVLNGIGTFACKELVYAYAMWISPRFHLAVIRAFDALVSGSLKPTLPQNYKEALLDLVAQVEANEKLQQQIALNAPKVAFAEAVGNTDDVILIRDLAKLLKQNGVDMGEKRLFIWLRENGYLTLDNKATQRSMNLGVFRMTESTIATPQGNQVRLTTKVTGRGQQYFLKRFTKQLKRV